MPSDAEGGYARELVSKASKRCWGQAQNLHGKRVACKPDEPTLTCLQPYACGTVACVQDIVHMLH